MPLRHLASEHGSASEMGVFVTEYSHEVAFFTCALRKQFSEASICCSMPSHGACCFGQFLAVAGQLA